MPGIFRRRKRASRKSKPSLSRGQVKQMNSIASKAISRRAEKKYYLHSNGSSSISDTGYIWPLSDVPQGDTDQTRNGDSLYLRTVRILGDVRAGDTTNACRVIVFQWLDDSTPTVASVLQTTSGVTAVFSPYLHDQRKKFRIMYDKMFVVAANGNDAKVFDTKYLRPPIKKVAFTAATTTGSNKIFLLLISDSTAVTHPALTHYSKVTYDDM